MSWHTERQRRFEVLRGGTGMIRAKLYSECLVHPCANSRTVGEFVCAMHKSQLMEAIPDGMTIIKIVKVKGMLYRHTHSARYDDCAKCAMELESQ